ncbi:MAG TPA: SsrA-binding protein SmpB [Chloroflexota bacterium]|jgi:SsrA-binding protein|nr:SsrA-binding protein SmpB [Chloroflexota bacterium]
MAKPEVRPNERTIATNRRAYHDYFIDEIFQAGVVLTGTEIKSIREGKVNLGDGYVRVVGREAWLENVYVAPYEHGGRENPEPVRRRKLLLHRGEIDELAGRLRNKGVTAVPLKLYLAKGRAKIELGLARGKRQYDKREAIAERDAQRDIERALNKRTWG